MKKLFALVMLFLLVKISHGQSVFQKTYDFSTINNTSRFIDAVYDNSGNMYLSGFLYESFKGYLILSKSDNNGNLIWSKTYQGAGPINMFWSADSNLIIWCYGGHPTGNNQRDFLFLKMDTTGQILTSKWYLSPNIEDFKLIKTKDGNYTAGGLMRDSNDVHTIYLLKIDTAGNLIFNYQYTCPTILGIGAQTLLEDDLGNLYLTGYEIDSIGYANAAVFKFDSVGNLLSNRVYVLPNYNGLSFGLFHENKIIAVGTITMSPLSAPYQNAIFFSIDTALNLLFSKRYYYSTYSFYFENLFQFTNDTCIYGLFNSGIYKLNSIGNILNSRHYSVSLSSTILNIKKHNQSFLLSGTTDVPEKCYLVKVDSLLHTYCYEGSGIVYDTLITPISTYSLNIIKNPYIIIQVDTLTFLATTPVVNTTSFCFGYSGINSFVSTTNSIIAYPNPFTDYITIETKGFQSIEIYNSTGQLIKSITIKNMESIQVNLKELPTGIYNLLLKSNENYVMQKLIKAN